MKPLEFPLLADENVDPEVVAVLRARGHDVQTAAESCGAGARDRDILRMAHSSGRVVVTHDADFAMLAVRDGEPFVGIVHLRPGHISASVVVGMLASVAAMAIEIETPFVIVADRRGDVTRVRARRVT